MSAGSAGACSWEDWCVLVGSSLWGVHKQQCNILSQGSGEKHACGPAGQPGHLPRPGGGLVSCLSKSAGAGAAVQILPLQVLVNKTPAAQLDNRDTFLALGEDW